MKASHSWKRPASQTTVFILAAAVISVVVLVWMGVRLVQQDRALEAQRLEERREGGADRLVGVLEQTLAAEERRLETGTLEFLGDDVLVVIAGADGLQVRPEGSLLYYPQVPAGREASPRLFATAERYEFVEHEYRRAVSVLQSLSRSSDPATRAGAQLRLARNLRKAGRLEEALGVYGELQGNPATVTGVPAELVARRARCVLLEELGRTGQLRSEARGLADRLSGGHWRIDRDSYLYYSGQAARWFAPEAESIDGRLSLTRAVCWLWENWRASESSEGVSAGRRSLRFADTHATVLWRVSGGRLSALVAGPAYQRRSWFEPFLASGDFGSLRLNLRDAAGSLVYGAEAPAGLPATLRPALYTGLPWDIVVTAADLDRQMGDFTQRRRFMMAGLAAVALLVMASSTLIARAVSRELAAARLQSDFVSAVSHEFRTPLTSMTQFTEMLVEDDDLPPEKRRLFYRAQQRSTRRLSRLVESLLDFGRMEAGARPYRREPLDAVGLARTVVEEFRQEAACDGFEIDCLLPDAPALVNGDREALGQALWNLLDNAVKYSGESRTLRLEVKVGTYADIRVRDEGYGIPASERDEILRKFGRGSSARAHGIKGTGIGLAMVKHIVDAHGGRLLIESEPGKGSTFTIRLPAGG